MADLSQQTFGDPKSPLRQLSDEALAQEVQQRRAARRKRSGPREGASQTAQRADGGGRLSQYYANLELKPGASLDDVRAAYRRLMAQYHPDRHQGDPERFAVARKLSESLTEAYRALSNALIRR